MTYEEQVKAIDEYYRIVQLRYAEDQEEYARITENYNNAMLQKNIIDDINEIHPGENIRFISLFVGIVKHNIKYKHGRFK